jgi:hypothetical protein
MSVKVEEAEKESRAVRGRLEEASRAFEDRIQATDKREALVVIARREVRGLKQEAEAAGVAAARLHQEGLDLQSAGEAARAELVEERVRVDSKRELLRDREHKAALLSDELKSKEQRLERAEANVREREQQAEQVLSASAAWENKFSLQSERNSAEAKCVQDQLEAVTRAKGELGLEAAALETHRQGMISVETALQARELHLQESWRVVAEQARQQAVAGAGKRGGGGQTFAIPLHMMDERNAAVAAQAIMQAPLLQVQLTAAGAAGSPEWVHVLSRQRTLLIERETRLQRWGMALQAESARVQASAEDLEAREAVVERAKVAAEKATVDAQHNTAHLDHYHAAAEEMRCDAETALMNVQTREARLDQGERDYQREIANLHMRSEDLKNQDRLLLEAKCAVEKREALVSASEAKAQMLTGMAAEERQRAEAALHASTAAQDRATSMSKAAEEREARLMTVQAAIEAEEKALDQRGHKIDVQEGVLTERCGQVARRIQEAEQRDLQLEKRESQLAALKAAIEERERQVSAVERQAADLIEREACAMQAEERAGEASAQLTHLRREMAAFKEGFQEERQEASLALHVREDALLAAEASLAKNKGEFERASEVAARCQRQLAEATAHLKSQREAEAKQWKQRSETLAAKEEAARVLKKQMEADQRALRAAAEAAAQVKP